jgi:PEGA domain
VGSAISRLSDVRRSSLLAAACAVALWLAAPRAFAQNDAANKKQAQALQVEGLRLMQKGDNQGALAKFEEAFRLVSSPKILFNMGKAHLALGDEPKATEELERFLDEAPYAPKESRDEAQRKLETLRPHLSYLEVQTDDVGSTISIDGQVVGTAPLARPSVVRPGAHEVRVEKSEMVTQVHQVAPIAGQKLRVVVKLVSAASPVVAAAPPTFAPAAGGPAAAPSSLAAAPSGAMPAATVTAGQPNGQDHGGTLRTTGIVLGSAGAAVVIVGMVFGLAAESDGDANAKTGATFSSSTYDAGHRDQTLQYVGYGLGAALIAAGVTTFLMGGHAHGQETAGVASGPTVSLAPTGGGALASAALRF